MSTMTKVFIVLTSVLAIVLSSLTVAAAAQWSNAKEDIEKYQELVASETVRRMQVESVMATSLAMKDDAIRQRDQMLAQANEEIRRQTDDLASVRTGLARTTNEKVAAEAGRNKLQEILDVQTAELNATRKQNELLVSENIELQTRNQRLSSRLLEVTGNLTVAAEQVRNLQEKLYAAEQAAKQAQVTAGPARVAAQPVDTPPSVSAVSPLVVGPIRGEVVEIDGRYVSISVGETSGVAEGMTFMIHRGGTYVGDLRVETVWPKKAGGKVVMLAQGLEVQVGDWVTYGLEGQ